MAPLSPLGWRRTACGNCRSPNLHSFLDLGASPLADAFPETDAPELAYPLELAVCTDCWLVQLMEVVPGSVLYDGDYGFYTGASPSSILYFSEYAKWALDRFGDQAHKLTVELASNDGTLLRHFARAGCPVLGVEPASNVVPSDLPTVVAPFGRRVAADIFGDRGPAGLIIANNVVAHVEDLDDFLGGMHDLLAPDGLAIIEVQYVGDLLTGNQFDHVYHEHRSFFSLGSLATTLAARGLHVLAYGFTSAQGGSLRVVASKRRSTQVAPESEEWLRSLSAYDGFQGRVDRVRDRLLDLLRQEERARRTVAGYGASAKSTTLLNYCGIGPDMLDYVADATPAKVGRLTPGTHIPILGPDDREPDTYLLLAWNYLAGVLRRERDYMQRGGRFIVPIPVPVVL